MVYEPFHMRQKVEEGEIPNGYIYDELSEEFRNRIGFTFRDCMLALRGNKIILEKICENILKNCNKYINAQIPEHSHSFDKIEDYIKNIRTFILVENDVHKIISVLEIICCEVITYKQDLRVARGTSENFINELNNCFSTFGIGFEFLIDQKLFVKINSKHTHQNIAKPAMELLQSPIFCNAEKDFKNALEHFKNGMFEDAIVSAHRSFEGVLRVICDERGWRYDKNLSKSYIDCLFENELIPKFQQNYFRELKSLLKTGVTPIRNMKGAHAIVGGEEGPSECQVEFVLDMVASSIKLLTKYYLEGNSS